MTTSSSALMLLQGGNQQRKEGRDEFQPSGSTRPVFPQPSVTLSCRLSFCQGERGLPGLPGEPGEKGDAGEGVVGPPVSTWIYRRARLQHLLFSATCNESLGSSSENMVVVVEHERRLWLKTL